MVTVLRRQSAWGGREGERERERRERGGAGGGGGEGGRERAHLPCLAVIVPTGSTCVRWGTCTQAQVSMSPPRARDSEGGTPREAGAALLYAKRKPEKRAAISGNSSYRRGKQGNANPEIKSGIVCNFFISLECTSNFNCSELQVPKFF